MADVHRTLAITAPLPVVWAVLADFGSLATWADGVDHSCLLHAADEPCAVGTVRRVQSGRDTFVETVTMGSAPHTLAYDIAGVPRPFTAANRWDLRALGRDATVVTLTSTVAAHTPVLRRLAERAFAVVMLRRSAGLLNSLARHVVSIERGGL